MSWLHIGAKNFWEDSGACGKFRLEAVSSRDGKIHTALGYTQQALMSRTVFMTIKNLYKSPWYSQLSGNIIPLTSTTSPQHKHHPHNTATMKATFFVSLLLSLGVTAMPEADTVTIKEGEFTYTGIDKVCNRKTRSS
jgi:hypothetical protein